MPGLFEGFITRHRRGVTLAALVTVSLVCLIVTDREIVLRSKETGLSVVSVFQRGATGFFRWFGDTADSIRKLAQARAELADARGRLQQMDRITRENLELRRQNSILTEQLELSQSLPVRRTAAEVIARDTDNLFSTITIDKGSRQGIARGMPVVAFQSDMEGLVGRVILVGSGSSQVLPLYDTQCFVSARLERTRDEGLVSGQGRDSQNIVMRYVKKTAKESLEYGDVVVTAGLGGAYPKGINIGRVREIRAESYETSLELSVEPIIDFDRLEYVFVIDSAEAPDAR